MPLDRLTGCSVSLPDVLYGRKDERKVVIPESIHYYSFVVSNRSVSL